MNRDVPHYVISFICLNIFCSTLFSDPHNLCSSIRVMKPHFASIQNSWQNCFTLYIHIHTWVFNVLESRQGDSFELNKNSHYQKIMFSPLEPNCTE